MSKSDFKDLPKFELKRVSSYFVIYVASHPHFIQVVLDELEIESVVDKFMFFGYTKDDIVIDYYSQSIIK